MRPSLRPYLFACLLGIAFLAGQALIYEPLVQPRLATWQAVPGAWWLVVFAPEIAVCIGATFAARNPKDAVVFCVLGGLVITTLQFLAGALNQPAHGKLVEGGALHFGMQFLVVTLLLSAVVSIAALVRLGLTRARAG